MADQPAARPGPDRFLLAIVVGALGLVAVGLLVALLANRAPTADSVDPGSPAGVVRSYIAAIQEDDARRAYQHLSQPAQAAHPFDEYQRDFSRGGQSSDREQRVLIEPISEGPERAVVKVTISTFSVSNDPFSATTYHRDVDVRLVHEDGVWHVDQPIEPYVFAY